MMGFSCALVAAVMDGWTADPEVNGGGGKLPTGGREGAVAVVALHARRGGTIPVLRFVTGNEWQRVIPIIFPPFIRPLPPPIHPSSSSSHPSSFSHPSIHPPPPIRSSILLRT
eukprot:GHVU01122057.1.p1 GENE.GHVU01122057.1~~GHVU01122057.1.p1  ORF type:complete len:113 (+),score=14.29 GHVU01122057.1:771-1109(+)